MSFFHAAGAEIPWSAGTIGPLGRRASGMTVAGFEPYGTMFPVWAAPAPVQPNTKRPTATVGNNMDLDIRINEAPLHSSRELFATSRLTGVVSA